MLASAAVVLSILLSSDIFVVWCSCTAICKYSSPLVFCKKNPIHSNGVAQFAIQLQRVQIFVHFDKNGIVTLAMQAIDRRSVTFPFDIGKRLTASVDGFFNAIQLLA